MGIAALPRLPAAGALSPIPEQCFQGAEASECKQKRIMMGDGAVKASKGVSRVSVTAARSPRWHDFQFCVFNDKDRDSALM